MRYPSGTLKAIGVSTKYWSFLGEWEHSFGSPYSKKLKTLIMSP